MGLAAPVEAPRQLPALVVGGVTYQRPSAELDAMLRTPGALGA